MNKTVNLYDKFSVDCDSNEANKHENGFLSPVILDEDGVEVSEQYDKFPKKYAAGTVPPPPPKRKTSNVTSNMNVWMPQSHPIITAFDSLESEDLVNKLCVRFPSDISINKDKRLRKQSKPKPPKPPKPKLDISNIKLTEKEEKQDELLPEETEQYHIGESLSSKIKLGFKNKAKNRKKRKKRTVSLPTKNLVNPDNRLQSKKKHRNKSKSKPKLNVGKSKSMDKSLAVFHKPANKNHKQRAEWLRMQSLQEGIIPTFRARLSTSDWKCYNCTFVNNGRETQCQFCLIPDTSELKFVVSKYNRNHSFIVRRFDTLSQILQRLYIADGKLAGCTLKMLCPNGRVAYNTEFDNPTMQELGIIPTLSNPKSRNCYKIRIDIIYDAYQTKFDQKQEPFLRAIESEYGVYIGCPVQVHSASKNQWVSGSVKCINHDCICIVYGNKMKWLELNSKLYRFHKNPNNISNSIHKTSSYNRKANGFHKLGFEVEPANADRRSNIRNQSYFTLPLHSKSRSGYPISPEKRHRSSTFVVSGSSANGVTRGNNPREEEKQDKPMSQLILHSNSVNRQRRNTGTNTSNKFYEQVTFFLRDAVKLPQYLPNFLDNECDIRMLSVIDDQALTNDLNIKNALHRKFLLKHIQLFNQSKQQFDEWLRFHSIDSYLVKQLQALCILNWDMFDFYIQSYQQLCALLNQDIQQIDEYHVQNCEKIWYLSQHNRDNYKHQTETQLQQHVQSALI